MSHRPVRRLLAVCAAGALLAVAAPTAIAASLVVNTLTDVASGNDGLCSLREAISAANTNAASGAVRGECPAGVGPDTITFSVNGTINLGSKLPDLISAITVDGAGAITLSAGGTSGIVLNDTDTTATLKGLTLTGGHAQYSGAILNAGNLTVVECTITGNIADDWGGGIVNLGSGTLVVTDSTISGNSAVSGGGIYIGSATGNTTVIRSTISGNAASGAGGGIYSEGKVSLANVTLAGNSSPSGGGIHIGAAGSLTMLNATVTGNQSNGIGGGIAEYSSSIVVKNSILSGNLAPGSNPNVAGLFNTDVNNLVDEDPATIFDPLGLQDNGGRTKTYGLLPTAVTAIDKGNAAACAAAPVSGLDQRGLARPAACDIGAVERDKTAPVATAPKVTLRAAGNQLSGTSIPVKVSWTGADNAAGSGISRYVLARSVNGDSYAVVSSSLTAAASYQLLVPGKTYRFRVRAIDRDGNAGSWVAGITVTTKLVQQTSASVHYGKTWSKKSLAEFSGGSVRYATAKGATASYAFTGRGVAFVTTRATTRGKVKVYIDGSYKATVDLAAPAAFRSVMYARTWSSSGKHTIKLVVLGTSGRPRVDLDAFVVLR